MSELHPRNRHTPSIRSPGMGGWNPWRALRARDHIDFRLAPLPYGLGAVYVPRGQRAAIVIDPSLTLIERNVALAHELVHDERGGGCHGSWMPASWEVMSAREENLVEREVARRLLPREDLVDFVQRRTESEIPTSVHDVAEQFEVTEPVAELSMLMLARER